MDANGSKIFLSAYADERRAINRPHARGRSRRGAWRAPQTEAQSAKKNFLQEQPPHFFQGLDEQGLDLPPGSATAGLDLPLQAVPVHPTHYQYVDRSQIENLGNDVNAGMELVKLLSVADN